MTPHKIFDNDPDQVADLDRHQGLVVVVDRLGRAWQRIGPLEPWYCAAPKVHRQGYTTQALLTKLGSIGLVFQHQEVVERSDWEAELESVPTPAEVAEDRREEAFREYFHNLIREILDGAVPKAKTYGTHELANLGRTLFETIHADSTRGIYNKASDQAAISTAVWFYVIGKTARWSAAVRRGEQPTQDTVVDVLVYCLMWLKVNETGEWWSE